MNQGGNTKLRLSSLKSFREEGLYLYLFEEVILRMKALNKYNTQIEFKQRKELKT